MSRWRATKASRVLAALQSTRNGTHPSVYIDLGDHFGLVAFGQIELRKIDGYRHVSELLAPAGASAA